MCVCLFTNQYGHDPTIKTFSNPNNVIILANQILANQIVYYKQELNYLRIKISDSILEKEVIFIHKEK